MASLSEKFNEIVDFVIDDYKDLQSLNPQHELLSLVKVTDHHFDVVRKEEFERRFMATSDIADNLYYRTATALKYDRAIRKAVRQELEKRLEHEGLLEMVRRYF